MMAVTSAWKTGIPVRRTRFWPRPMILPSLTMTAPNGPPHPFSTDSMASRVASWANCFLYSLLSISVVLMSLYFSVVFVGLFQRGMGLVLLFSRRKGTDEFVACSFMSHEFPKDCN